MTSSATAQLPEHVHVAVMGAGPGGISTAYQLLQRDITDFVVLEKWNWPGGTWYHNRYLGGGGHRRTSTPSRGCSRPTGRFRTRATPRSARYSLSTVEKYGIDEHANTAPWRCALARWDDARSRRPSRSPTAARSPPTSW
ncbi:MAG: NAD(P)-binding protein [Acidimicrobiia bacterium]